MVGDIFLRIGEAILAILLVAFVLFKLALSLDMVPEDFSPKGLIINEYKAFKKELSYQAGTDDLQGKVSGFILKTLERIEKNSAEEAKKEAAADAIADQCQENSIFRFFMFMGKDAAHNTECSPSNLNLKHADKELQQQLSKPIITPNPTTPVN